MHESGGHAVHESGGHAVHESGGHSQQRELDHAVTSNYALGTQRVTDDYNPPGGS